ncbi:OmcA/MtrC family decaheme c-type cytochrome [Shewanella inventionis]|uniref:Surface localized decaheme cytochrome c lipoprotein n=1 Tax=Shewanella inventionis TaxID=1738770 RepID=A0ABQ1JGC0_9GAMM|nr:OmcA/MtrC family decaheme c-type cytochrome [Shewanella inventionis]MCL1159546.1 OmcA/MtrC family decaheme c-type cytochrome [Shewanella inventionis]GGB67703.1 surface localized decaheme cytochrome c lipoprotein [Shewanella inventionis]
MKKYNRTLLAAAFIAAFGIAGCGSDGSDGADGVDGVNGVDGVDGADGTSAALTVTTVENAYDFNLTLDPADIVVVGSDPFSIKFTVSGIGTGNKVVPFSGLERVALYVMSQSENTTDTGAPMLWTSHTLANDFGSSMYCNLTGSTTARDGSVVNACTLVEDTANPGTYTGSWTHEGNAPVVLTDGDANDLVRVIIRAYDVVDADGTSISDKILSTPLDFIPATGELAVSEKDSVSNAACIKCHSSLDGYADTDMRIANIDAHHNYQKVENCVACHNPAYAGGQDDPEKGYNANFNAMIHTIHAGHQIADSLTGEAKEMFGEIGFPSELNECTACHDNGTQWNDNIYAEACVSCHVDVDLTTGDNHNGIIPASDAVCSGCHGAGSLSPMQAHNVGVRAMTTDSIVMSVSNVVYAEDAVDVSGVMQDQMTITFDVTVDGSPIVDGFDFADYANYDEIKTGTVDADGTYYVGTSVNLSGVVSSGGKFVVTKVANFNVAGQTIAITPRFSVCADSDAKLVACQDASGEDQYAVEYVAVTMDTKYWNLANADGSGANIARQSVPSMVTADEAKCSTCHTSLGIAKHYGNERFDQCMGCHNNTWGGSYHVTVEYKTDEVNDDGEPVFATIDDLTYNNRDLMTVSHRFHSGLWDDNRGFPAINLNSNMETQGYPAVATECSACHKDDMNIFAADGGLASGKRAIAVNSAGTQFISPVAESCRTCHAHSDAAALAHFKANGATVEGEPDTTADLPVESCATCHAEGKTYGIDTVHSTVAH